MEELRLPWNDKEGLLYGGIIAVITCFVMMFFNICKSNGAVEFEYLVNTITCLPFIWVAVMLLMSVFVGRAANAIVRRFTEPTDGFNTRIAFNIIACVTMMSMIMTFVGPTIGSIVSGEPSLDALYEWPHNWPVNFCAAFWTEMILAQPAARAVMKRMHIRQLKARNQEGAASE